MWVGERWKKRQDGWGVMSERSSGVHSIGKRN